MSQILRYKTGSTVPNVLTTDKRLEVVGEQHLRCVGHAPSPDSRLMYDLADVIATRARGRYG